MKRAVAWIALAIIVSGCGGGSGHSVPQPTFQVSVSLSPASQQSIDQGQSVSFTASVANDSNNQGVSWSLSGSGCSGSACGTLTNATTTAARYNAPASVASAFTVSVTATSVKDPAVYESTTMAVSPAPVVTTTSMREGTPGAAYSDTLQASGGAGSLSWSIVAGTGSLPNGLTLDAASGLISGTPTAGGTATFTVQVTDSANTPMSAEKQLSITIVSQTLTIATTSLPGGTEGVAYSATLQQEYGTLPVSWSVTAGMPNGLTLDASSGLISGTPTATGTSTFTVTATDSSNPAQNASRQLSITINPGGADDALLDGHYAFLLSGYDSTGEPVAVAGSFFADGSGGVQGGLEDINRYAANAVASQSTFSGSYSVGADHRGTITITNSVTTYTMAVAMGAVSSGVAAKGSILEFDSSGYTMSGVIDQQDFAAFSQSALNGSYAFGFTGSDNTPGRLGLVGKFSAGGSGGITGGLFDSNDNGSLTAGGTFSGAYTAVDSSNGRTEVTLASVSPAPADYAFYVVSAAKWLAISLDNSATSGLVTGQVEAQSGGPYASGSLNGTAVVSMGASPTGATGGGSHVTLGLAAFDGSGNVSFSLDDNDSGTLSTLSPNGTYAVTDATAGRFTVSPQGMSQMVGYLTTVNQGFILGTGADVATGVFLPQSTGPFASSSLNATVFFGAEPFAAPPVPPPLGGPTASLSVGVLSFDGSGNLSGTSDSNQLGTLNSGQAISDTYAVSANGRVTVGSNSQVLYIVSPAKILSMSTDAKDPNPTLGFGQQ